MRRSELELSAARAHFGDAAVAEFAAALEAARGEMLRGFTLRQQLDDDIPEDEPTKRRMLAEIITVCRSADERLDAQVAAFDQLRNLEATAPDYLAGLATRLDATNARLPVAEARWAALQKQYAPRVVGARRGQPRPGPQPPRPAPRRSCAEARAGPRRRARRRLPPIARAGSAALTPRPGPGAAGSATRSAAGPGPRAASAAWRLAAEPEAGAGGPAAPPARPGRDRAAPSAAGPLPTGPTAQGPRPPAAQAAGGSDGATGRQRRLTERR